MTTETERSDEVFFRVQDELAKACSEFGPFKNGHEGYAVLLEEVDELWQAVKHGTHQEAMEEAVQVAAMAIRFVLDLSDVEGRRA